MASTVSLPCSFSISLITRLSCIGEFLFFSSGVVVVAAFSSFFLKLFTFSSFFSFSVCAAVVVFLGLHCLFWWALEKLRGFVCFSHGDILRVSGYWTGFDAHMLIWKLNWSSVREWQPSVKELCQLGNYVNWGIMSTGELCQLGNYVNWGIMSTGELCQLGNYVNWGIMSTEELCQLGNYVN